MDETAFDRFARAVSGAGSRRGLLRLVLGLPLAGLLTQLHDDESIAKRKRHGRRRGHRPGKHKDNRKGKRKGGKGGGGQCGGNGSLCEQDGDCCSRNCFNFICADRVTTCGAGDATRQCVPPAKGCAGGKCCYGAAGCGDTCCELPANQCNPQNECCVPNCDGRQCGPDGCGTGGTCGSCSSGQTCDDRTGQCVATCSAQNCPHGCCDAAGKCQFGTSAQACGKDGETCHACASGETCLGGVCRNVAGTCTTHVETCQTGLNSPCNNSGGACTCDLTIDGADVCRNRNGFACSSCNSNEDCGPGNVCIPCADCLPANKACAALCPG
jgi:hypothetical protein